jgi:hypothetical protein
MPPKSPRLRAASRCSLRRAFSVHSQAIQVTTAACCWCCGAEIVAVESAQASGDSEQVNASEALRARIDSDEALGFDCSTRMHSEEGGWGWRKRRRRRRRRRRRLGQVKTPGFDCSTRMHPVLEGWTPSWNSLGAARPPDAYGPAAAPAPADTALSQPGSVRLFSVLFFCSEEEKGSIADCRRNAAAYGPAAAPDTALNQPGSVRLLSVLFSSWEEATSLVAAVLTTPEAPAPVDSTADTTLSQWIAGICWIPL